MLRVRAFTPDDLENVRKLHLAYYDEYDFPDFLNLLVGYIIEDENTNIVMAGGIEAVAEAVLVTNKAQGRIKIGRGLIEAQRISLYVANKFKIKELLAFTNDPNYTVHLVRHGFEPRGGALSMKVPNG